MKCPLFLYRPTQPEWTGPQPQITRSQDEPVGGSPATPVLRSLTAPQDLAWAQPLTGHQIQHIAAELLGVRLGHGHGAFSERRGNIQANRLRTTRGASLDPRNPKTRHVPKPPSAPRKSASSLHRKQAATSFTPTSHRESEEEIRTHPGWPCCHADSWDCLVPRSPRAD